MGAARRGAARRVFEARVKRRPTRRFFPLQTGHRWWVARTLVVAIEAVPSYLFFSHATNTMSSAARSRHQRRAMDGTYMLY